MLFVDYRIRLADCDYPSIQMYNRLIELDPEIKGLFDVANGFYRKEIIITTRSSIVLRSIRNALNTMQPGLVDGFV